MIGTRTSRAKSSASARRGFTLVELIIVMTLLGVVMASAAPSLSRFFRGRKLDSEVSRFVALTRYSQGLAAERAVPMILWIDLENAKYGLRAESGDLLRDVAEDSQRLALAVSDGVFEKRKATFRMGENLRFVVENSTTSSGSLDSIRFLPDGTIDPASPKVVQIVQDDPHGQTQPEVNWIAQSRNLTRYEVVDSTTARDRSETQMRMDGGVYVR